MVTQLWLKHRPDTMTNMVGLDSLKTDTKTWATYEDNRHQLRCGGVIFAGNPGTGKTSAARAIAMDLLGNTNFSANYHVFNASDDRGIQFVRDRLKALAQQKASNSPFKVINLDEADGLTRDAQDALRQIIEETSTHTLWILTCNRVARIIPALRSRLPTYTFNPLQIDEADGFLRGVIEEEGFPSEWKDLIPQLVTKHRGDLRSCLKTLQICSPDDPNSLALLVKHDVECVALLFEYVSNESWDLAIEQSNEVVSQGVTREEAIETMHNCIMELYSDGEITSVQALRFLLIIGQWAARSADWTAGDIIFLHSIVGDIQQRG